MPCVHYTRSSSYLRDHKRRTILPRLPPARFTLSPRVLKLYRSPPPNKFLDRRESTVYACYTPAKPTLARSEKPLCPRYELAACGGVYERGCSRHKCSLLRARRRRHSGNRAFGGQRGAAKEAAGAAALGPGAYAGKPGL